MRLPAVFEIDGVPRNYAWGSTSAIPELLGRSSDGQPVAELWFGAHPDDPSPVTGADITLPAGIEADPVALLGEQVVAEFGPHLPFLLKLLAANKPLSIQVHPTRAQAEVGFDREDAAGIAQDAPQRNYRDRNHKPELLTALTTFEALCGFRPVAQTLAIFDALAVPELAEVRALLAGPDGLRAAFTHLLQLGKPTALIDAVVARAAQLADDPQWAGPARAVALTAAEFPSDVGVVLTLLLNYVRLEPGEAIFLGAGNVHCYLQGLGVEVMAASDNVLRCGLTPKHVDVDEVLAVAEFVELPDPRCPDDSLGGHGHDYDIPVDDFGLFVLNLDNRTGPGTFEVPGPFIALCTLGSVTIRSADVSLDLTRGRAAYICPPRDQAITVGGVGRVHIAAPNWH